jgi:hypothetical protein
MMFVFGFICGAGALLAFALYLSNKSKPRQDEVKWSAVTTGADALEPYAAYQMREIFRDLEKGRA